MTHMTGRLTTHAIAQGIREDRERASRATWAASEPARWIEPVDTQPRPISTIEPARRVRPESRAQLYESKKFIETLQQENLGQLPPNLFNALRSLHDAIEMVAGEVEGRDVDDAEKSDRRRVG